MCSGTHCVIERVNQLFGPGRQDTMHVRLVQRHLHVSVSFEGVTNSMIAASIGFRVDAGDLSLTLLHASLSILSTQDNLNAGCMCTEPM